MYIFVFCHVMASQQNILHIAKLQLQLLAQRLEAQDYQFNVSQSALERLAIIGFDPIYGARPLKRAIQQLENPLAELILSGRYAPGDTINVSTKSNELVFN